MSAATGGVLAALERSRQNPMAGARWSPRRAGFKEKGRNKPVAFSSRKGSRGSGRRLPLEIDSLDCFSAVISCVRSRRMHLRSTHLYARGRSGERVPGNVSLRNSPGAAIAVKAEAGRWQTTGFRRGRASSWIAASRQTLAVPIPSELLPVARPGSIPAHPDTASIGTLPRRPHLSNGKPYEL